ncbi:MAG: leucyl/phenylalanyl-tRNA--protein transferase [Kofleriaceae bacterium]|nr:leucyl/phenylalanyl-tRNA--protein transferase [Myxococcales bacterium]MCB9560680.1 leucyl/phenylalanyl-tRNA--protein transferase [Kofleriaceae bacterium]
MPVFRLDKRLVFPPVELAEDGLLAVGGDLRPERLLLAYSRGIFPWYGKNLPILWHSPDPRMVLYPDELIVNRSLKKQLRRAPYQLRLDTAFGDVLRGCATVPRLGQGGTWLVPDMISAYQRMHELGFAHSAEAWLGDRLVGGLYGVCLGGCYFGESMFAEAPDASKLAFVALVRQLQAWGIGLIDCQVHTEHLERFGAREIPREQFLAELEAALEQPTRRGKWTFEIDLAALGTSGAAPGAAGTSGASGASGAPAA